jgi:hypothetical protein
MLVRSLEPYIFINQSITLTMNLTFKGFEAKVQVTNNQVTSVSGVVLPEMIHTVTNMVEWCMKHTVNWTTINYFLREVMKGGEVKTIMSDYAEECKKEIEEAKASEEYFNDSSYNDEIWWAFHAPEYSTVETAKFTNPNKEILDFDY